MAKYSPWIGRKISKIMHEGMRGKDVPRKQAIAAAISMARKKGMKTPAPLKQKAYRKMLRSRR